MHFHYGLMTYFRQRDRGWILSLFVAVSLVYLPFLGNPFVFDDLHFFSGEMPEHYAYSLLELELRFVSYASLGWTAVIFSDAVPHVFRLGNILLHAANVILLFYLLRQWGNAVVNDNGKAAAIVWGAWLGALFFAMHPVAVYAVGYVVQRSVLMATFFVLLMQLAYLRGLLTAQKRWLVLSAAAYFLAVFSKEHSVLAPALLAMTTVLLRHKTEAGRRELWLTWVAYFAIAVLVTLRAKGVLGAAYEPFAAELFEQKGFEDSTVMHGLSVLTQAGLFFKYLLLWWLPNPAWMSIDMRETFILSWSSWQGWLGAISFVTYGVFGFWLLVRPRWLGLVGVALLYPWLQFLVEFSSIRIAEPLVLYRSYLWLPGMMLVFPVLLAWLPGRKILIGLGLTVTLLLPLAWNRLWVFSDNYRLWDDAVVLLRSDAEPGADRIFYNRGQAAAAKQNWEDAITDFKKSVALRPQLAPLRYTLGMTYFKAGQYAEAIKQFDAEIALKPDDARAYYGKGLSLMGLKESKQALQQMKIGCELGSEMACMMASWSKKK